jgi:hypothetical protein
MHGNRPPAYNNNRTRAYGKAQSLNLTTQFSVKQKKEQAMKEVQVEDQVLQSRYSTSGTSNLQA